MSGKWHTSQYRAFFSFDAAFALLFAAGVLFSFVLLETAAVKSAQDSAVSESGSLLALRLSSVVLQKLEIKNGTYARAWEIDPAAVSALDAAELASLAGRNYTSVSLHGSQGVAYPPAAYGTPDSQIFCANRLVLFDGEPARLEVCVS